MKYAWIDQHRDRHTVSWLCRVLSVSRSGHATGRTVELAWADRGSTGGQPRQDAKAHGIELQVIKLTEAKKGFVPLPKHWMVERSFACAARSCQLPKDCERLPDLLQGLHLLVLAILMLLEAVPSLMAAGNSQHTL